MNQVSKESNTSNPQLFESLISPIYTDLYKFIFSLAKNKELADDILQESLYIAYTHLTSLKDQNKFKSWIFTIAKRTAIAFLKKNHREISMDISEYLIQSVDLSYAQPEFENLSSDIFEAITDILQHLKPAYREIIILLYYYEFTLEEVAESLHMNYNTAKSKHLRAKKKIHGELKKRKLIP